MRESTKVRVHSREKQERDAEIGSEIGAERDTEGGRYNVKPCE